MIEIEQDRVRVALNRADVGAMLLQAALRHRTGRPARVFLEGAKGWIAFAKKALR